MKRKLIWLNLVLAGLLVAAGLKIRDEWTQRQQKREAVKQRTLKSVPPPTVDTPAAPVPVTAANYSDIAQKMLFNKERNPNIQVEVPPAPVKPMPPLPLLRGVMGLPSGTLALMSIDAKAPGVGVKVGDKIGQFTLAALSADEISLKWEDKTVTKSVLEMIHHAQEQPAPANAPAVAQTAGAAPPPSGQNGKPLAPITGSADGIKSCVPGDTAPAGTVTDGYRKVVTATPFGSSCRWEPVK
jgi:hypothetical protein